MNDITGTQNEHASTEKRSPVYVVHVVMSSQNRMLGSQEVSETQILVDYKYPKKVRKQIASIRMRCMKPIYEGALDFFGVHYCTHKQKDEIIISVKAADKELKELDISLGATVVFMPIDVYDVAKGDMYGQVIAAIRSRIIGEIIEKISDKAGQLTKQSKEAMQRLIQKLRSVNVMNDPEVDRQLDSIYQKILTEDIDVVKKDLQKELKITQSRVGYIQL